MIHEDKIKNEGGEEKAEMIMSLHLISCDDYLRDINSTINDQNRVTNSNGSEVKKNVPTKALSDGDLEDG